MSTLTHGLRPVYILDAVRTPIGRIRGGLAAVRPDDLLGFIFASAVARAALPPERIDEVYAGCANQAGEDNRNVARMAVLLAGLPESIPAVTVNRLCASGLTAVNQAARQIACGEAELCLAGGVESMTRAPLVLEKGAYPFAGGNRTAFDTSLGWRFPNPRLEARFPLEAMGETAENLAEEFRIDREAQDRYALESHQRATRAEAEGRFEAERVPVPLPDGGDFAVDEGPRKDTTFEKLQTLKPAFRKGGTVSAGNSSTLNDGAACLVLASESMARSLGRSPLARWVAAQSAGVSPRRMGYGPVPAIQKLLARSELDLTQIDALELNEAFAVQALAVLQGLGASETLRARTNSNGGAIALGHPLGASGARILTTLIHHLVRTEGRRGIAALCVGVGQGEATLIERV